MCKRTTRERKASSMAEYEGRGRLRFEYERVWEVVEHGVIWADSREEALELAEDPGEGLLEGRHEGMISVSHLREVPE